MRLRASVLTIVLIPILAIVVVSMVVTLVNHPRTSPIVWAGGGSAVVIGVACILVNEAKSLRAGLRRALVGSASVLAGGALVAWALLGGLTRNIEGQWLLPCALLLVQLAKTAHDKPGTASEISAPPAR